MLDRYGIAGYKALMWKLGPLRLQSRLLLGTQHYSDLETMGAVHAESEVEVITLSIRETNVDAQSADSILHHIDRTKTHLVPSTAGCFTPEDAVSTAKMASELLETQWIKLEVTGCARTLFPDMEGTLEAARELAKEGFYVLASTTDDPVLCQRLADFGCVAVLPLTAPKYSGLGVANQNRLHMIRDSVSIPMIVEAGIGSASDATLAMELGADAVLANTAVAKAKDPVQMAHAMKLAVQSGRTAFLAGRMQQCLSVDASTPEADTVAPSMKGASSWP